MQRDQAIFPGLRGVGDDPDDVDALVDEKVLRPDLRDLVHPGAGIGADLKQPKIELTEVKSVRVGLLGSRHRARLPELDHVLEGAHDLDDLPAEMEFGDE